MTEQPHRPSPDQPRRDQPNPGQPAPYAGEHHPGARPGHAEVAATAPPERPDRHDVAAPGFMRRVSWGAILAGTVIVLVVQMMLSALGIGVGALAAGTDPGAGLAIGAVVWWIVAGLVALFVGGWVAGYLAGARERLDGVLHGLVTWGLASVLGAFLLATAAGNVAGGALQIMDVGASAAQAAPDPSQQQMDQLMQEADGQEVQQELEQAAQQFQAQAPTAEEAQEAVAHAGIWSFVAMLLGGLAAAVGGLVGAPQDAPRTHLRA